MKLHDGWNIYSPATVQDLDYDGVGEIVIAHGGDPVIPAEVWICTIVLQQHNARNRTQWVHAIINTAQIH